MAKTIGNPDSVALQAGITFDIQSFNEHHDDHGRFSEGDGGGSSSESSGEHGRQPSASEMEHAQSVVEQAKKEDIQITVRHEPPQGKAEQRLAERAKEKGETAVVVKSSPRVYAEPYGKEGTTYFHDDNVYAHTYPDPKREGRWVSEQYQHDREIGNYPIAKTSYATKERATAASKWHASHAYDSAAVDHSTKYVMTKDVGHTVASVLASHREESIAPDTHVKDIKILR